MALRVLLADNSETIKKVIQLTLQDYAIDLKIVTQGVDVVDVALKFKPDIVFVDILLQKKSGYDVSKELKLHPQLKATPVVLMWSGFMEFDEKKAQESLADARLEKPFDAQMLRGVVNKLVKKTTSQNIAQFLDFPTIPQETAPQQPPQMPTISNKSTKTPDPLKDLAKIKQESEKFSIPKMAPLQPASTNFDLPDIPLGDDPSENQQAEDFEMKNLSQPAASADLEQTKSFVLNIPEDSTIDDVPVDFGKMESIEDMSFLLSPEEAKKAKPHNPPPPPPPTSEKTEVTRTELATSAQIPTPPTPLELENIVKTQAHEIIEKIAWQVVPELAAQIIKSELERLLRESNQNPKA